MSGNIGPGQISVNHLASGVLTAGLTSGVITSGLIGNAAVVSGSIASGQISVNHLASGVLTAWIVRICIRGTLCIYPSHFLASGLACAR